MFNTPGHGMWIQFKLPDAAAKIAEEAGAYKTRQNLFAGIFQREARTVENVIVPPPRIVLIDDKGDNLKHLVKPAWKVVEPWVLLPPVEAQILTLFADDGCIGVAEDVSPIDYKEDIPKARRPDYHPKDLRRPLLSPWEIAQRRAVEQQKRMSQGVDSPDEQQQEETKGEDEATGEEGDRPSSDDVPSEAGEPEHEKVEESKQSGNPVQVRQPENPPKNPEVALNTGRKMKR
jgi:hypothetical protein